MPDHPLWLERVPAVLDFLAGPEAPPLLGRGSIEALLGVRRRRAILILHACEASQRGRNLVATRKAFMAFLEGQRHEETLIRERQRQQQVAEALGRARRERAGPSISLPRPQTALTLAGLPAGIHLTRGNLSVEFTTAPDLIEKLFTVAQVFAHDYESLEAALQPEPEEETEPDADAE